MELIQVKFYDSLIIICWKTVLQFNIYTNSLKKKFAENFIKKTLSPNKWDLKTISLQLIVERYLQSSNWCVLVIS